MFFSLSFCFCNSTVFNENNQTQKELENMNILETNHKLTKLKQFRIKLPIHFDPLHIILKKMLQNTWVSARNGWRIIAKFHF